MAFRFYNWEEIDINWESLNMNWEAIGILEELIHSGSISYISKNKYKVDLKQINKDLPDEKKRVIIKLACKINGKEFIEYKYKKDFKVTIGHINTILNEFSKNNIRVNVQNIS